MALPRACGEAEPRSAVRGTGDWLSQAVTRPAHVTGFGCRPRAELATRAKVAGPAFEAASERNRGSGAPLSAGAVGVWLALPAQWWCCETDADADS